MSKHIEKAKEFKAKFDNFDYSDFNNEKVWNEYLSIVHEAYGYFGNNIRNFSSWDITTFDGLVSGAVYNLPFHIDNEEDLKGYSRFVKNKADENKENELMKLLGLT